MTPDDYLEKLLDAIEQNNYWDVEAYSQKILSNLHNVKTEFRAELKAKVESIFKEAQEQYKKERSKQDLISDILSAPKDERIKLK
jgi:hypothetical protein